MTNKPQTTQIISSLNFKKDKNTGDIEGLFFNCASCGKSFQEEREADLNLLLPTQIANRTTYGLGWDRLSIEVFFNKNILN